MILPCPHRPLLLVHPTNTSCFPLSSSCLWLHSCPSAGQNASHFSIINCVYPRHSIPGHHKHHLKDSCTERVATAIHEGNFVLLQKSKSNRELVEKPRPVYSLHQKKKKKNVDESKHTSGGKKPMKLCFKNMG